LLDARIEGFGNENPIRVLGIVKDMSIKRIVIEWDQRIEQREMEKGLFQSEQELEEWGI
jgi:hypothetical protein